MLNITEVLLAEYQKLVIAQIDKGEQITDWMDFVKAKLIKKDSSKESSNEGSSSLSGNEEEAHNQMTTFNALENSFDNRFVILKEVPDKEAFFSQIKKANKVVLKQNETSISFEYTLQLPKSFVNYFKAKVTNDTLFGQKMFRQTLSFVHKDDAEAFFYFFQSNPNWQDVQPDKDDYYADSRQIIFNQTLNVRMDCLKNYLTIVHPLT